MLPSCWGVCVCMHDVPRHGFFRGRHEDLPPSSLTHLLSIEVGDCRGIPPRSLALTDPPELVKTEEAPEDECEDDDEPTLRA